MNIIEVLTILTFIIVSAMMLIQIINTSVPTLADILVIADSIHCHEVRVYRNGKRLKYEAWITYATNSVQYYEVTDGILYIRIS